MTVPVATLQNPMFLDISGPDRAGSLKSNIKGKWHKVSGSDPFAARRTRFRGEFAFRWRRPSDTVLSRTVGREEGSAYLAGEKRIGRLNQFEEGFISANMHRP